MINLIKHTKNCIFQLWKLFTTFVKRPLEMAAELQIEDSIFKTYSFFGDGVKQPTNWTKEEQIGCGGYGKVYKAKATFNNQELHFAVKHLEVPQKKNDSIYKEKILPEIETMKKLKHDRIVRYMGCYIEDFNVYIFMELMNISLEDHLKDCTLDLPTAFKFIRQIIEGLDHLRTKNILHRDIKSGNILIDSEGNIKLADFGVSKVCKTLSQNQTPFVGTMKYMAPERLTSKGGFPADLWSCCCVFVEMVTGEIYPNIEMHQMYLVLDKKPSPLNYLTQPLPKKATEFLEKVFEINVADRPTSRELLARIPEIDDIETNLFDDISFDERDADDIEAFDELDTGTLETDSVPVLDDLDSVELQERRYLYRENSCQIYLDVLNPSEYEDDDDDVLKMHGDDVNMEHEEKRFGNEDPVDNNDENEDHINNDNKDEKPEDKNIYYNNYTYSRTKNIFNIKIKNLFYSEK
ncbi:Mitogen-activated protein kinase kinase kinase 2 [Bulinus truncatus]|nr:Mitogen-activated protein kinase kinase kinase 2 [Bulinus truncatus]